MPTYDRLPRRYIFFALAALALLMAYLDMTVIGIMIPAITNSLGTSLSWASWTITSYQLVQIVVMPLSGKLSDTLGGKRVFMFSVVCFVLGSLLCGLAPNIGFLIAFRILQAIGAGGILPAAVRLVSDEFKERQGQMIGLFSSISPIGGILGPNLGGWMLGHWSWREIFLINVPIGVVVLIGVQLLLKERRGSKGALRVDVAGLTLFSSAMIALMYGMTIAGTEPALFRSPLLWLLFVAALALFWKFIRHEGRAKQPVMDPQLLFRRPFWPINIFNLLFGASGYSIFAFIPYFAVVQYHMTPAQTGAVLTPRMLATILIAALTSIFIMRVGYRIPMIVGMVLNALGLAALGLGWSQIMVGSLELDGFWLMTVFVGITGLAVGLMAPSSNNAGLDLLPGREAAMTGLRSTIRMIGGIVFTALIVLLLSFYDDKAAGMRAIFIGVALLFVIATPLILMIPDPVLERRRSQRLRAVVTPGAGSGAEGTSMEETSAG